MNRNDLVAEYARKAQVSQTKAREIVLDVLETIRQPLLRDESVVLADFGTFSVVERPAREGRNPATGADIHIPAKTTVKFKPSKNLLG